MEAAAFPERKCRETIWSDLGMAYSCDLPDRHPGPHATLSLGQTVEARDRWEANHPDWREQIDTTDFLA